MITKETALKIWNAYREKENSENLLQELTEQLKKVKENTIPTFNNAFGEKVGLQLGVPSGLTSHTLFNVSPVLAKTIILEHIENSNKRLKELMSDAVLDLGAAGLTPYKPGQSKGLKIIIEGPSGFGKTKLIDAILNSIGSIDIYTSNRDLTPLCDSTEYLIEKDTIKN
jgi:ABC-type uncharacterized transport system fused permease/ATPase subunit